MSGKRTQFRFSDNQYEKFRPTENAPKIGKDGKKEFSFVDNSRVIPQTSKYRSIDQPVYYSQNNNKNVKVENMTVQVQVQVPSVNCPLDKLVGCNWKGPKDELSAHVQGCMYQQKNKIQKPSVREGPAPQSFIEQNVKELVAVIEDKMKLYMSRQEIFNQLNETYSEEVLFTVWERIKTENQEFFDAYKLRLQVKQHMNAFNNLCCDVEKSLSQEAMLQQIGDLQLEAMIQMQIRQAQLETQQKQIRQQTMLQLLHNGYQEQSPAQMDVFEQQQNDLQQQFEQYFMSQLQ
ncbi:hypothetical protein AKO1_004355 [Acrasis kona]|uniref:Uncharacterized protein n=1 Tax=Acrasis kona TaxID=1008807 RepID=A0AAW2Z8B3_9EUKA